MRSYRLWTVSASFFILFSFGFTQQPDWAKVHELTVQGIDQVYNLEFDKANGTFDEVIRIAPKDPRGYFFKSTVDYWIFLVNKDKKAFDHYIALTDTVIDLCDKMIDIDENNWNAKFYLGGAYGFRGLMHQRNGSMMKAVWDGRKGYKLLQEVAERKPDLYDAQMGFGLFTYMVGKIPKSFRWVVNILGFSGDLEGGLNYLRAAAEKGTYTRNEASYYLAQFLYQENHQEEAKKHLERLTQKYSDNTLFRLTQINWQMRENKWDEALATANATIEINTRKNIRYGDEFAYSTLGGIYFTQNNFERSIANYEAYLERSENKDNINNAVYFRIGTCYEILGNREKAVEMYKRMKKVNDRDRPTETYSYRRGTERLQKPMTEFELELTKAANLLNYGKQEQAVQQYNVAFSKAGPNIDYQTLALYGLQQAYFEWNKLDESIETGRKVSKMKPLGETWLVPHSYFKMGQAYAKQGKTNEARQMFEIAQKFDDYDFQSGLENRLEDELKKLKSGT
jgi:tetratricopeptide (TPR) repeat protein